MAVDLIIVHDRKSVVLNLADLPPDTGICSFPWLQVGEAARVTPSENRRGSYVCISHLIRAFSFIYICSGLMSNIPTRPANLIQ